MAQQHTNMEMHSPSGEAIGGTMQEKTTYVQGSGGGYENSWIGEIAALGLVFGGGIYGNRGAVASELSDVAKTSDVTNATYRITDNDDANTSDLRNTIYNGFNQNRTDLVQLSGQVGSGFDRVTGTVRTVGDVLAAGQAGINGNIKDIQFQNSLNTKEILGAICEQTNTLVAMDKDAQIRDAERREEEAKRERDLLATGNFPISQPAHLHRFGDNMHMVPNQAVQQDAINIAIGQGIAQGVEQGVTAASRIMGK